MLPDMAGKKAAGEPAFPMKIPEFEQRGYNSELRYPVEWISVSRNQELRS
jgi:hypothetical protein